MNKERKKSLTKEFLEENYIDENGCGMFVELAEYLDCVKKTSQKYFKQFGVVLVRRGSAHINQERLKLITKEFLEKNYMNLNGKSGLKKLAEYLNCTELTAKVIFKKYGLNFFNNRKSNINKNRWQLIDKEFLEENYTDAKGAWLINEFVDFMGCSEASAREQFRKFGVIYKQRREMFNINRGRLNNLNNISFKEKFINEQNQLLVKDCMNYLNCSESFVRYLVKKFDLTYTKRKGSSKGEDLIVKFIISLDPNTPIIRNSQKVIGPKELDIYLPEYNLAVEFNGLLWHSHGHHTLRSPPTRHALR